jgi:ribosomal protein L37AE/L43A
VSSYYAEECKNCGRVRVLRDTGDEHSDGVCEKCGWDADGGDYAAVTRPGFWTPQGRDSTFGEPENNPFEGVS